MAIASSGLDRASARQVFSISVILRASPDQVGKGAPQAEQHGLQPVLLRGCERWQKMLQQLSGSFLGHDYVCRYGRSHGHAGVQGLPGVLLTLPEG